jgi:hypothetical protein
MAGRAEESRWTSPAAASRCRPASISGTLSRNVEVGVYEGGVASNQQELSWLCPISLVTRHIDSEEQLLSLGCVHPGLKGDAMLSTSPHTAQSVLAMVEDILRKAVPTIGLLFPNYTPMISLLIFGCAALALRFPVALDSDEPDNRVAIT